MGVSSEAGNELRLEVRVNLSDKSFKLEVCMNAAQLFFHHDHSLREEFHRSLFRFQRAAAETISQAHKTDVTVNALSDGFDAL